MSSTDDDEKVREMAYHLWEQAGRPADRHDEFWHQAREHLKTPPEAPKPGTPPVSDNAKAGP